jgi:hypothetical protein
MKVDAGLLAAAQVVKHFEISRYSSLKTWATELGFTSAARLLEQTLAEEKRQTRPGASSPNRTSTNTPRRLDTCVTGLPHGRLHVRRARSKAAKL